MHTYAIRCNCECVWMHSKNSEKSAPSAYRIGINNYEPMSVNSSKGGVNDELNPGMSIDTAPNAFGMTRKQTGEA